MCRKGDYAQRIVGLLALADLGVTGLNADPDMGEIRLAELAQSVIRGRAGREMPSLWVHSPTPGWTDLGKNVNTFGVTVQRPLIWALRYIALGCSRLCAIGSGSSRTRRPTEGQRWEPARRGTTQGIHRFGTGPACRSWCPPYESGSPSVPAFTPRTSAPSTACPVSST